MNKDEKSVVDIQNHELNGQLALINQLDDDETHTLVKIINSMLTKKRMKDLMDGKIKLAYKVKPEYEVRVMLSINPGFSN